MTFQAFESVTDELLGLELQKDVDGLIDKIESLLSKREAVIKEIDASEDSSKPSDEVLNRLVQKNLQLETKLQEIMLYIQNNLDGVKKEKTLSSLKKKAHRGYMNVGRQNDGYFIDKKK